MTAGRGLDALDAYFGRYLPQLVQTVIATPVIVLVMWSQDWISGLTVLLTLPLIPIFMVLIGLATRAVQQRQWQTLQRLAARFSDTVQGLATLKVFGRQHRAAASIERVTDDYRRETMRVLRVSFLSGFALEFLASISVAIIAVSIGFRLLDGSLALAVGLFVLLLAPEAYLPLRQVGVQFHAAAEGVAATDDVFEVLDAARARRRADRARELRDRPRARAATCAGRSRDARASAAASAPCRRSTLVARPGTVTLIEGPSGAGKSSVFAALRGAAPWTGAATYGGADVARPRPRRRGSRGRASSPDSSPGRSPTNVALGDAAPDARARRDARSRWPMRRRLDPDAVLGVQGAGLSGGQAQRVAVARAIYRHLSRPRGGDRARRAERRARRRRPRRALWRAVRGLADRRRHRAARLAPHDAPARSPTRSCASSRARWSA